MSILRLEEDLLLIADKDPLGRQLQDAGLIVKKRAPKRKKQVSDLNQIFDKGDLGKVEFE